MDHELSIISGGYRTAGIFNETSAGMPLVTVITAVFNAREFIAGCLQSVKAQDYPNLEHLILDGGSTDGTVELLKQYNDTIAYWKSEPDLGIYDAWNKGIRIARGEWICFLGADDKLLPGAISSYMRLAAANPDAEYLSSQVLWTHPSGYRRTIGEPWEWRRFSRFMCSAHVGSMHRSNLFTRLGYYDLSYRIVADYELLLRARQSLKAAYMAVTTVSMRGGGVSYSTAALRETAKAKVRSGGRNSIAAKLDLCIALAKFAARTKLAARGEASSQ